MASFASCVNTCTDECSGSVLCPGLQWFQECESVPCRPDMGRAVASCYSLESQHSATAAALTTPSIHCDTLLSSILLLLHAWLTHFTRWPGFKNHVLSPLYRARWKHDCLLQQKRWSGEWRTIRSCVRLHQRRAFLCF